MVFIRERTYAICHHLRGRPVSCHLIIREACVLGGLVGWSLEWLLIFLKQATILPLQPGHSLGQELNWHLHQLLNIVFLAHLRLSVLVRSEELRHHSLIQTICGHRLFSSLDWAGENLLSIQLFIVLAPSRDLGALDELSVLLEVRLDLV